MAKRKKLNGFGMRRDASYIKLDYGLTSTDAWQTLSPDATKVLLDLWRRHTGMNNGRISYSVREARECLCKARGKPKLDNRRAVKALQEIAASGFAVVTRASTFDLKSKLAREWRLTAEPANGEPATRDFMAVKIQNTGVPSTPHRCSLNTCEPESTP